MSAAFFLILLAASDTAAGSMAVLPLQARRVEPEIVAIIDDLLATELSTHHDAQVISSSDIEAMLNVEQQKDAFGCDDVTCAAEIGGALGAQYLITGSVSRLGEKLIVQLSHRRLGDSPAPGTLGGAWGFVLEMRSCRRLVPEKK